MNKTKMVLAAKSISNLGFSMNNAYTRILRRAMIAGLIVFIGEMVLGYSPLVDPLYLPVIVALGQAMDKALREYLGSLEV